MKKNLTNSSKFDSSKLGKKEAPIKLDQAIEKMSTLLGDHLNFRGNLSGGADLPTYSLEDYVILLNERYNKIVELLTQEEESLMTAQQENSKLKEKLAEEVKNHQETVQLAKTEIDQLVEKNKEMLAKRHSQNMEKQYKEIEVKCNDEKIEIIETEIKKNMEMEIQLRAEILENERNVKFLESELDSIEGVTKSEEQRNKELEKKLDDMQKDYEAFKRQFNSLKNKNSEIDQKLNSLYNQKSACTENTDKIIQEQKTTLKKTHTNYQKLEELDKLKKKLVDELEVKSEQLNLIRTRNQELESKIKGMEFIEKEIKVQEEINSQLSVENELLTRQFEDISNILGKHTNTARILNQSNRKILEAKDMKEYENMIKDNPNFRREPHLEPQKLVDQNLEYRAMVENLQREINEKLGIIERQKMKMKEIQDSYESNNVQLCQDVEEKNVVENKYDELSKKIGFVSVQSQVVENKKSDMSFNKSDEKNPFNYSGKKETNLINNNINDNIYGNDKNYRYVNKQSTENKSNDVIFGSPPKKQNVIESKSINKSEKISKSKEFPEYDILNKNPIKLELNEISKTMKGLEELKHNKSKDLKTLDNI